MTPERLIARLGPELRALLGHDLLGLYLVGSYAAGDFDPMHSDVDFVAVLARLPSEGKLERLRELHARIVEDAPEWEDRVEVAYVPLEYLRTFRQERSTIAKISPGEPLHVMEAGREYLVNWYLLREIGRPLFGPDPKDLVPQIAKEEFLTVVQEHAESWPVWVEEMHHLGGQAYAVVTACRAIYALSTGEQASKRKAAEWAGQMYPEWAELIHWAADWRDQTVADPRAQHDLVRAFVVFVAAQSSSFD